MSDKKGTVKVKEWIDKTDTNRQDSIRKDDASKYNYSSHISKTKPASSNANQLGSANVPPSDNQAPRVNHLVDKVSSVPASTLKTANHLVSKLYTTKMKNSRGRDTSITLQQYQKMLKEASKKATKIKSKQTQKCASLNF